MRVHKIHGVANLKSSSVYFKWSAIIVLLGSFYAWQQIESRRLGYRISEINTKISLLSMENKYLTMKIMDITAMSNLEKIATQQFGLVVPKPSDVVVIKELQ
ncbi:MAG: hypothetical protein ABID79_00255 [Elusimicrobiota bacterium]